MIINILTKGDVKMEENKVACEQGNSNGRLAPKNSSFMKFRLCRDSRKDECPYHVHVEFTKKNLHFNQDFCTFE